MLRLGQVSSKYSRVNSSIQDSPSPSYIRCLRAASLPHLLAHSLALTCLGQLDATTAPRLAATLAAEPRETWAELQRPIGDEVIRRVVLIGYVHTSGQTCYDRRCYSEERVGYLSATYY